MLWISISFHLQQNIVNADRFRKRRRAFLEKQTSVPSSYPSFSKFSNRSNTNQEIHVGTNHNAPLQKREHEKRKHLLQVKDALKEKRVLEEEGDKTYPFHDYLETHDGSHETYGSNGVHFNGTYGAFHKPDKRESARIIPNVSIKKKFHFVPSISFKNTETNETNDIYLQSFNVKKQKPNVQLNTDTLANSHIELRNKMTQQLSNKTGISPTLNFFASKALDGVLGGIQQQLQGPVPLDPAGNNSPLAMPIVTPNLGPNMNNLPGSAVPNVVSNVPPVINQPPSASSPRPPPPPQSSPQSPSAPPLVPPSSQPPMLLRGMARGDAPNPMLMTPQMNPNAMPFGDISNSSAFNIHPTGVNMKDNPSNVTSSEVVSITIGIVLSLFFFCFISGCLVKMCKPKKRRRR